MGIAKINIIPMNQISLRPILAFMKKQGRAYLTAGDWQQLENKISNQRAKKAAAGQNITTEDEYLKMLAPLREMFNQKPQVANDKIITALNKVLIAHKHGYQKQEHPSRHLKNIFFHPSQFTPNHRVYDIAFYSPATGGRHKAHHIHEGLHSTYYMRCEEEDDLILFGNMQIDARDLSDWAWPERGEIMLQKKNIYGMMVQEAVKHGLASGKEKIMFQCGDANEFTQWGARRLKTVTVTKRNFKKFEENYLEKIKGFGPHGYQTGDVYKPSSGLNMHHYVTAIGPEQYQVYQGSSFVQPLLMCLRHKVGERSGKLSGEALTKWVDKAQGLLPELFSHHKEGDYAKLLTEIKMLLQELTSEKLPAEHTPEQLARLKKIFPYGLEIFDFVNCLDALWHEFEYDKIIFARFPELKKFQIRDNELVSSRVVYYNCQDKDLNLTFKKSDYKAPEIGKSYLSPADDRYNINFASTPREEYAHHQHIYNWYEKTLYQEFKKYGLGVERVPITTVRRGRKITAHAWEIKSGLKEFKQRPIAIFSTRGELKMDCETLPRLQIAAAKFGCTPSQLTIVNDFLTEGQAPKRSGAYEKDTGEIYLANHSLAILAHEGLHKLKARGVIPAAEYRALVQAGKRIAQTTAKEKAYINQRDAEDNLIYPPGRARNEEYAAIFVETYYENNRVARKNLLGKKLTVTEKVFDYIKTVRDTVLARVGMPAAIARKFLRQVEGKYYQTEIQTRPSPVPAGICPSLAPPNGLVREP